MVTCLRASADPLGSKDLRSLDFPGLVVDKDLHMYWEERRGGCGLDAGYSVCKLCRVNGAQQSCRRGSRVLWRP